MLGKLITSLGHSIIRGLSFTKKSELLQERNHLQLGMSAFEKGDFEQARRHYDEWLHKNFDDHIAWCLLGDLLLKQCSYDEAIVAFKESLEINPRFYPALMKLGVTFATAKKNLELSEQFLLKAIEVNPDSASAYTNLGNINKAKHIRHKAIELYEKAVNIDPGFVPGWSNLGLEYHQLGKLDQAVTAYRKALELSPEKLDTRTGLIGSLLMGACTDPVKLFSEICAYGQYVRPNNEVRKLTNLPEPYRQLRVGFLSADFRHHSVAYFVEPILEHYDRKQLFVTCYYNYPMEDQVSLRLKKLVDSWQIVHDLNDVQLLELITGDHIDILIDLSGHTVGNRLSLFPRRAAPVQITYLGYPTSTGLTEMDYRLTDYYTEPIGLTEHLNTERLLRLPDCFCSYRPHENSPAPITTSPILSLGHFTFGCFNNYSKINEAVIALWAKILLRVPTAKLLLEAEIFSDPWVIDEVEAKFAQYEIGSNQLKLMKRLPENKYLLYNQVDLALDPFPCNGGTTSFDSLWMGVPFVTLAGNMFASRMGVSLLSTIGLTELIAYSTEEYMEIAVGLAQNTDRLISLRDGLRERFAQSPLMDKKRFASNFTQGLRQTWKSWCVSQTEQ